jgi:hypothetical protein
MWFMLYLAMLGREHKGKAVAAEAHIAKRCEGLEEAVLKSKKRHVESVTRLPTKRMATACWAFIVAKTGRLETVAKPESAPLQTANTKVMHRLPTRRCG